MRSLKKPLRISWISRTPNTAVPSKCGLLSMFTMLHQRRLRWMGRVRRIKNGRSPEDILYRESIAGNHNFGRPQLRYRDVCKRDIKELNMCLNKWEGHGLIRVEKISASYFKSWRT